MRHNTDRIQYYSFDKITILVLHLVIFPDMGYNKWCNLGKINKKKTCLSNPLVGGWEGFKTFMTDWLQPKCRSLLAFNEHPICLPVSQELTGCSGVSSLVFGLVWDQFHAAEWRFLIQEACCAVEPWPWGRTACHTSTVNLRQAEWCKHTQTSQYYIRVTYDEAMLLGIFPFL